MMKYLYCFLVYFLSCSCCFIGVEFFIGWIEELELNLFLETILAALKSSLIASLIAVIIHALFDFIFRVMKK